MFLTVIRRKFFKELTITGIVLTALVGRHILLDYTPQVLSLVPGHSYILLHHRAVIHRVGIVLLSCNARQIADVLHGVQGNEIRSKRIHDGRLRHLG